MEVGVKEHIMSDIVICPKVAECKYEPKDLNPHCRTHKHDDSCTKRLPICPHCIPVQGETLTTCPNCKITGPHQEWLRMHLFLKMCK